MIGVSIEGRESIHDCIACSILFIAIVKASPIERFTLTGCLAPPKLGISKLIGET